MRRKSIATAPGNSAEAAFVRKLNWDTTETRLRQHNTSNHQAKNRCCQKCDWAKAHYDKQKAGKASHGTAVRSLAMKWLRIIWAMLKSGLPYDEAKYLDACQAKRKAS